MRKLVLTTAFAIIACVAFAQDKIELRPTGRILMDAGMFDNKAMTDGVAIPDFRLGVKARYQNFNMKIDMGFSYGKVSIKDVMVERAVSKNDLLRVGYFVHQYGLQSATSSSMKITMEEPASNQLFFNDRLPGIMWIHSQNSFFGTLSLHAENKSIFQSTDKMGEQGYGAMGRWVYRPVHEEGKIMQFGISAAYEKARWNEDESLNHSSFRFKTNFPSRVSKVEAMNALVDHAKNLYKFTPEVCMAYGRVGLESQYYFLNVNREKGFSNYRASGAYGILRGIIAGKNYQYSMSDCGIATPQPGTMELALGYNYSDLSDSKAAIHGGIQNDLSLTFNYYINKYMIWRIRYSYTTVSDHFADKMKVNGLQTRFQVKF